MRLLRWSVNRHVGPFQRRPGGLLAELAIWSLALPGLAAASVLPSCSTIGTVTAGPVFSYSSESGAGYGWSASAGYADLPGPGLAFGIGQTWRHENVAWPAAPGSPTDGRRIELLTYFDFGLRGYFVESFPSYGQVSLSFGPAWSSLSGDQRAGLVVDLAPAAAFVPGQYTWPKCGTTTVSAPTFMAIVGVRWLYGSTEVYVSPQFGFVSENVSGQSCCY